MHPVSLAEIAAIELSPSLMTNRTRITESSPTTRVQIATVLLLIALSQQVPRHLPSRRPRFLKLNLKSLRLPLRGPRRYVRRLRPDLCARPQWASQVPETPLPRRLQRPAASRCRRLVLHRLLQ